MAAVPGPFAEVLVSIRVYWLVVGACLQDHQVEGKKNRDSLATDSPMICENENPHLTERPECVDTVTNMARLKL
jgi:hypothetical protein